MRSRSHCVSAHPWQPHQGATKRQDAHDDQVHIVTWSLVKFVLFFAQENAGHLRLHEQQNANKDCRDNGCKDPRHRHTLFHAARVDKPVSIRIGRLQAIFQRVVDGDMLSDDFVAQSKIENTNADHGDYNSGVADDTSALEKQ